MSVTTQQRHKLNRDPNKDPHIILLEFQEDGEEAIERAAINTDDVIFKGETYSAVNIEVQLPNAENGSATANLSVSNTERILGKVIDQATRQISVRMMLYDVAVENVTVIDTKNLLVAEATTVTGVIIEMQLGARATFQEPLGRRSTRATFPGTWK